MGQFRFSETVLKGLVIVEPAVFGDERGFFMETYNERDFINAGIDAPFVQDNHSKSKKGVLRGMHFQVKRPQGKLVRVISGEVFDVAVDLRKSSPTLKKWFGTVLSADNKRQMYVPGGFAHGFLVLSETAEFVYKCTDFYDPHDELGLRYDDPAVGIAWPSTDSAPLVSEKDLALPSFDDVCGLLNLYDKNGA